MLHSQKIKYIIVPLGVQWLVTGAVPSRFGTLGIGYIFVIPLFQGYFKATQIK